MTTTATVATDKSSTSTPQVPMQCSNYLIVQQVIMYNDATHKLIFNFEKKIKVHWGTFNFFCHNKNVRKEIS